VWLATKYAADRTNLPPLALDELGMQDAIKYRRLVDQHEDVRRAPGEAISDHYSRLQHAHDQWRNADTTDADRRAVDPRAKPVVDEAAKTPAWATRFQETAPVAPSPTSPAGLPQRIPGWYTGDAMDAPPPGYGTPPMPKRNPGDSMRPSHGPSYAPKSQSIKDWVQGLLEKGISVDHNLQRPDAVNATRSPAPMLRGHDIWGEFTKPGRHRRAASAIVTGFIEGLGEMPRKTASVHKVLTDDGWSYHESGSGNWYQKKIGDKVHVIHRQPDGWIHNSGPTADDMTGTPLMTDDIHNAIMRANRGNVQVGFKPPPIGHQNLSSNSWSDER
jgi:hypothetical protein